MQTDDVIVPDLGDFADVEVIEVLVKPGDEIAPETALITLESDKATMDIPAPRAGIVEALHVKAGDRVSAGTRILSLKASSPASPAVPAAVAPGAPAVTASESRARAPAAPVGRHAELLVLGAGPGGYTAAFRAADLGKKVLLVERYPTLGGVCLNVGCIPSKALLHAAKVLAEARAFAAHGLKFGPVEIELDKLRAWKDSVVGQLTAGLARLARQRKVEVLQGRATFVSPHSVRVVTEKGTEDISFEQAIIAAGSQSVRLPGFPEDSRVIDSTGALELADIPARLLVVGGGIIGLEMATVYHELGSRVTVVELADELMVGVDRDLVAPLEKRMRKQYEQILLGTKVREVSADGAGLNVAFEGKQAIEPTRFDRILLAVGRRPNGRAIEAGAAGVTVTDQGFIPVDRHMRTNVPHIYAIGDIVGQPMLAHKASHEGKVAAEVAAGHKRAFEASVIPSVAYTDPEVAWVGVSETQAKREVRDIGKASFPWAASGRSLALGRSEGQTKLIFDKETGRVIGGGIVGPNAGDLIAEIGLAIEMGADAADIAMTIHPHPTLSETVAMAAEIYEGSITDLYVPKR